MRDNLGCWCFIIGQIEMCVCMCTRIRSKSVCIVVHPTVAAHPSLSITLLTKTSPLILICVWFQSLTCAASIPRLWMPPVA